MELTEQDLARVQGMMQEAAVTGAELAGRGYSPDEVRRLFAQAGAAIVAATIAGGVEDVRFAVVPGDARASAGAGGQQLR